MFDQRPHHAHPLRLGAIVATPRSLALIPMPEITAALRRHASHDWGDLCCEDQRANRDAVRHGARVLSQYASSGGTKFWIITEADRSSTTVLLPEEY